MNAEEAFHWLEDRRCEVKFAYSKLEEKMGWYVWSDNQLVPGFDPESLIAAVEDAILQI